MSSEVCPFCGKTYKRLKSHLPHCKAAASAKTPPTKDAAVNQKLSSHPAPAFLKTTSKGIKTKQTSSVVIDLSSDRSKTDSVPLLKPVQFTTSLDGSSSSTSSSSSSQKKTQTLAAPSTSSLLFSTLSKPKKKSLRALIEAAKSEHIEKETLKGARLASEDVNLIRTSQQTGTKAAADSFKDTSVASVPAETKANKEPKMKDVSTTKYTSNYLDSNLTKNNLDPRCVRENLWVDAGDWETKEGSVKPGGDRQTRVTLQDVKATLGRATGHRRASRPSILSCIAAADDPSRGIGPDGDLSLNLKHAGDHLATPTTQSDKQLSTKKQPRELQLFKPPQQEADRQLGAASACAQVQQRPSSLSLKTDPHGGLLPVSTPPSQFSSHLLSPAAAPNSPRMDLQQLDIRKKNAAEKPTEGLPTQRSLGQVRLKELPDWLASRTPSRPTEVVEMVQRGWLWYYRRYIDVKKGGVGGLSMLLAGYCMLSYTWSYPHIKLSRWRKYH